MAEALWIAEQEVVALIDMADAIAALRTGFAEEAKGHAANMVKTHASWGDHATLHAIGAVFEGAGIVGTKTWAHTPGGATPLLILLDAADGALLAIIEAFALGQLRTGGTSGVATDLMARADVHDMALIGAGKQALAQIASVAAVRPIERVRVWSPTPEKRTAFAARAAEALALDVRPTNTLEEAVAGAGVITLSTRARAVP